MINFLHCPPPLAKLTTLIASLLVALTLAAPATAQVDYTPIGGKMGPGACPSGVSQMHTNRFTVTRPEPGATSVEIKGNQYLLSWLRIVTSKPLNTSFTLRLEVNDGRGNTIANNSLGTATADNAIQRQTITVPNLKPGESYSASLWTTTGGGGSRNLSRICFQMGPSLNYGQQPGFNLGSDPLGATGCFAIGGVRLGGGVNAVRACQCGARNSSGQWARTDSADGYEYILPAARRTELGCTTN